jgi:hypothetical protein
MEFSFLKLRTRSHKYRALLSQPEINAVLDKFVPKLRSVQILNVKKFPEVQDECYEEMDRIVEEAREALKEQLRIKIKKNGGHTLPFIVGSVVAQISGESSHEDFSST